MTDDATARVRADWNEQATTWRHWAPRMFEDSRPIHEWMVRALDPQPGQRVLEVGAGPGDTGFLAAPQLAGGRLVSTDIAPLMVSIARARGAERGLTNVEHEVLDAQAMQFDDASFDGILCRWTLMLVPNPSAAFAECFRVLKPGGRFVFAVFTTADANPWASMPARILTERGHLSPPGSKWRPGINALGDRAKLESLVRTAGFRACDIEAIDMVWTFSDADDHWAFLTTVTAMGPLIRSLPADAQAALRSHVDSALRTFETAGGYALPGQCWGGRATR